MNGEERIPAPPISADQAWEAMCQQLDSQVTEPLVSERSAGKRIPWASRVRLLKFLSAAAGIIGLVLLIDLSASRPGLKSGQKNSKTSRQGETESKLSTQEASDNHGAATETSGSETGRVAIFGLKTEGQNTAESTSGFTQIQSASGNRNGEGRNASNIKLRGSSTAKETYSASAIDNSSNASISQKPAKFTVTPESASTTGSFESSASTVIKAVTGNAKPEEIAAIEKELRISTPRMMATKKSLPIDEGFDIPDLSMISPGRIPASARSKRNKSGIQLGLDFGLPIPLQGMDYYLQNSEGKTAIYQPLLPAPWIAYELAPNQRIRMHFNPWQTYQAGKMLIDTNVIQQSRVDTLALLVENRLINISSLQLGIQYQYSFARNWTAGIGIAWNLQRKALIHEQRTRIWNNKSMGDSLFSPNRSHTIWQHFNRSYFTGNFELSYQWKKFQLGAQISKPIIAPVKNRAPKPINAELLIRWRLH